MTKKHVVITGGTKGIGLDATKLFLKAGFKVTIIARDFSKVQKFDDCHFITYDLRDIQGISKLVSEIGDIDVLVNNAGIMNTCSFDQYSTENKEDLLKINLEAPVELITHFSKGMIEKKAGRIINIASIAGQIGHPDIWYGISKAGIINMTKSFAKILGKHGIIVNAIAPGIVETSMLNSIPKDRQESVLRSVQSGRFARSEEIANTILWLSTESPMYINGTCIDINDGAFPR